MSSDGPSGRLRDSDSPIAVVGLALRLPGASTPEAFWRMLCEGRESITAPPERLGVSSANRDHYWGGYLDRPEEFDAAFFGISPREALAMDPQQRIMLELSWEALESARTAPDSLRGSETGVFTGAISSDYSLLRSRSDGGAHHTMTGTQRGMIANRVSYTLGLSGPSLTVDSGQSSSLVAVHMAAESLRRGECSLALAGGVNLILAPESTEDAALFGALSPDARCYTFDARANGYARGEGGAVVVLKPLERALADGDPVHAVLRGGAVNNSGQTSYLARPEAPGQEAVLRAALRRAQAEPSQVGYVELHGTGTPAGDPVEARALGSVFSPGREDPLHVGSAKTNVGHLEGAAGIVGLVKTVLSLSHGQLPPTRNFSEPHPDIDLEALRLSPQTRREPWPVDAPLAGVSSFGVGGTNCHLVLGPPPPAKSDRSGPAAGRGRCPLSPGCCPPVRRRRCARRLRHCTSSSRPGPDCGRRTWACPWPRPAPCSSTAPSSSPRWTTDRANRNRSRPHRYRSKAHVPGRYWSSPDRAGNGRGWPATCWTATVSSRRGSHGGCRSARGPWSPSWTGRWRRCCAETPSPRRSPVRKPGWTWCSRCCGR